MLNGLLLWKQIIWFNGLPEALTSSSAQGYLRKTILHATIFKDSRNILFYSGNSEYKPSMLDTCCLQLIWTASGKTLRKHLPSVSITQTAWLLACPTQHVDLLSSSSSTDPEVQFYNNTFTARIAKKLGVHTKVQVTDLCQGWQQDNTAELKSQRAVWVATVEVPKISSLESSKTTLCLPGHVPVCAFGSLPSG